MVHPPGAPPPTSVESAAPPPGARALAIAAVVVGGTSGGFIGWAFVALQCRGECTTPSALGAAIGAVLAAAGVAVLAVLVLRAMTEWRTIEHSGDPAAARRAAQEARRRS
ncbi:MAG: hypothetical protein HYX34_01300 [Actinobacteria bacterium]|nr:hypothetical protein [Actinomycetota bacterium]